MQNQSSYDPDSKQQEIYELWQNDSRLRSFAEYVFILIAILTIAKIASLLLVEWFNTSSGIEQGIFPEVFGIMITILVIDMQNKRRDENRLKRRLCIMMGSRVNQQALAAVAELRAHGWFQDNTMKGRDFTEANLQNAHIGFDRHFELKSGQSKLQYVKLRNANLRGAFLHHTDLRGADLRGADLYMANLAGANLAGANLRGANLRYAILENVKLVDQDPDNPEQKITAILNANTILPDGTSFPEPDDKKSELQSSRECQKRLAKQIYDMEDPDRKKRKKWNDANMQECTILRQYCFERLEGSYRIELLLDKYVSPNHENKWQPDVPVSYYTHDYLLLPAARRSACHFPQELEFDELKRLFDQLDVSKPELIHAIKILYGALRMEDKMVDWKEVKSQNQAIANQMQASVTSQETPVSSNGEV